MATAAALKTRLWRAVTTWPGARDWVGAGAVLVLFAVLALVLGTSSGFFQLQPSQTPILLLFLRALLLPSLAEEVVFRVLPPRRYAGLALALYVLYHPLSAWLLLPAARPIFYNPTFLLLAALLGACCTVLYRRTGSLWPPVALHGLAVGSWLAYLGGEAALRLS